MSSFLYATRLIWDGRQGLIKLHGVEIQTKVKMVIPGLEFESIDYIPEIHLCLIRQLAEPQRDMYPHEVALADRFILETFKEVTYGKR